MTLIPSSLTANVLADAGRLISFAARPKEIPARSLAYQEVVDRYLDDRDFAAVCDEIAAGAGLTLHVERSVGVVAVAESDAAWRMPLATFIAKAGDRRALAGIVLLVIVKLAYPHDGQIDDLARVPQVSEQQVLEQLNRMADALDTASPDLESDTEPELFRQWKALPQARSDLVRSSTKDRSGLVRKVFAYFFEQGLFKQPTSAGGPWRVTPRFAVIARSVLEDSDLYAELLRITEGSGTDDVGVRDLAGGNAVVGDEERADIEGAEAP